MDATSLTQIAQWSGGVLFGETTSLVRRVVTDSRVATAGDLFVALQGERFDGHDYLEEVAARGVAGVLAQAGCGIRPAGLCVVEVEDTLAGLQRLAGAYRKTLPARIVGVTGSSGKTTTKDFTFAVLSEQWKGWCTQGNLNNHIGVPLTLLAGSSEHAVAVVEMGMNHAGEIAPLAELAIPEVAIITNVGVAHIEFLGSREAIAREKGSLAARVGISGTVVLGAGDEYTPLIASLTSAQILTAGIDAGDLQAVDVSPTEGGSRFGLCYEGERVEVTLAVPGMHMVRNAAMAVAAGVALGMPLAVAASGLSDIRLTKGRMESRMLQGIHFLDDTYNANPDSMKAALATLAQWPASGRRIAVLGRMGELGSHAEAGHRSVGEAAAAGIDALFTVGAEAEWISDEAWRRGLGDLQHFPDIPAAVGALKSELMEGDVVLVKGSRSAQMERFIEEVTRP